MERFTLKSLLVIVFVAICTVNHGQGETEQRNTLGDSIKRYRVTIKMLSGEKSDGILWAVTDSTLLFVANTRAERLAYASGVQPIPDTVRAKDIRRIALRRRGHFARVVVPGLGIATTLFLVTWSSPSPTLNDYLGKLLIGGIAAPVIALSSIAHGLTPPTRKPVWGNKKRFRQVAAKLNRYSIRSQIQGDSLRTAIGR